MLQVGARPPTGTWKKGKTPDGRVIHASAKAHRPHV